MLIRIATFLFIFYISFCYDLVLSEKSKKCRYCKDFKKTGDSPYEVLWDLKNELGKELPSAVASQKMLLTSEDIKTAEGYFLEYCRNYCRHLFEGNNCERINQFTSKNEKVLRFQSLDEEKKFTEQAKKEFKKTTNKPLKKDVKKKLAETVPKKTKKKSKNPENVKNKKQEKESLDEKYAKFYHNILFSPRIAKLENNPPTNTVNGAKTLGVLTGFGGSSRSTTDATDQPDQEQKLSSMAPDMVSDITDVTVSTALSLEETTQKSTGNMTTSEELTTEETTDEKNETEDDKVEQTTEMNSDEDNTKSTENDSKENDKNTSDEDTDKDTENIDPESNETSDNEEQPEKSEEDSSENEKIYSKNNPKDFLENIFYALNSNPKGSDEKAILIICIIDAILSEIESSLGLQLGEIPRKPCGGKNGLHLDFGLVPLMANIMKEISLNPPLNEEVFDWNNSQNQKPTFAMNFNNPIGMYTEYYNEEPAPHYDARGNVDYTNFPSFNNNEYFDHPNTLGIDYENNWNPVFDDYFNPNGFDYNDYLVPGRADFHDNLNSHGTNYPGTGGSETLGLEPNLENNIGSYTPDLDGMNMNGRSLNNENSVDNAGDFKHWQSLQGKYQNTESERKSDGNQREDRIDESNEGKSYEGNSSDETSLSEESAGK